MARFLGEPPPLDLGPVLGEALAGRVRERINPRARRISLRVDAAASTIVLVRPRRAGAETVIRFVSTQRQWIARQIAALPTGPRLDDGSVVSILGADLVLRHRASARGGVRRDSGELIVSGAREHLARRLRDWLKSEAKRELGHMARELASRLGRPLKRLVIRDPKTRWGSCGPDGAISLSWRLMLAPHHVARYVVAHEIAHLQHMNHSAAFWRTVDSLVPDRAAARAWLRANGPALHQFGKS